MDSAFGQLMLNTFNHIELGFLRKGVGGKNK